MQRKKPRTVLSSGTARETSRRRREERLRPLGVADHRAAAVYGRIKSSAKVQGKEKECGAEKRRHGLFRKWQEGNAKGL